MEGWKMFRCSKTDCQYMHWIISLWYMGKTAGKQIKALISMWLLILLQPLFIWFIFCILSKCSPVYRTMKAIIVFYLHKSFWSLCLSVGSFFPALKPSETVFKVVFWLGYFNSCINPMIYPCSSKEFQRAFTRLLRCQCHQRQRVLRRFYDQRWRTAVKGVTKDQRGDYRPNYAVHEPCSTSLCPNASGRWLGLKRWSLYPPLQKSSFQLKEKVNNLSNKIKGGTGKSTTPAMGRIDIVDTISMGIYNCEQSSYQFYDLADCYGLKETDI